MRTLKRGDNPLCARETIERFDRRFVVNRTVLNASFVVEEGVLRTDRRIVEAAGDRVNWRGLSLGIFEHEAFEPVHDAFVSEGYRRRVIS